LLQIDYDIKRTNLYEEVADKLEQMIMSNATMLGEKLPSEHVLANKFGVSRNIVRESLKLLKERGLVVVRVGDGAYISRPESDMLTQMIVRIATMEGSDGTDIWDIRLLLETESCRLAAKTATEKDLAELEEIIGEMAAHFEDEKRRATLDVQFHTRIAEISGNWLLVLFVHSMADLLQMMIRQAIRKSLGADSVLSDHQNLVDSLRKKDSELTMQVIREQLLRSKERYQKSINS